MADIVNRCHPGLLLRAQLPLRILHFGRVFSETHAPRGRACSTRPDCQNTRRWKAVASGIQVSRTSYHFTLLPLPVAVIAQSTVPRSSACIPRRTRCRRLAAEMVEASEAKARWSGFSIPWVGEPRNRSCKKHLAGNGYIATSLTPIFSRSLLRQRSSLATLRAWSSSVFSPAGRFRRESAHRRKRGERRGADVDLPRAHGRMTSGPCTLISGQLFN